MTICNECGECIPKNEGYYTIYGKTIHKDCIESIWKKRGIGVQPHER
jgi:hypothetical protein